MNRILLALIVVVVAACGRTPAQPVAVASSPERALCLADAVGDGPIERQIAEAKRAVDANPGKMELWVQLGRAWVEKARNSGDPGFYLHADACGREVLKHEPDNALGLNLRGLALMNDHKFEEARDIARHTLDKDHDDIMAWGTLSDALLELGDIEGAEKAAQEMMDRKPSLPSYARASWLKWLRGDEAGALEAIRLAYDSGRLQKDHEPGAWVLSEAANIFWARGDVEGSLAGYEKALMEKSDEVPALVGKARCLIAQGKVADAMPLLQQAFAKTPLVETAWWISKAHEVQGDAVAAEQWRKRAIDTGKEGDRRSLALLLATTSKDAADIALAKKSIDEDNAHRGGPWSDDVAALVAYRMGDLVTAQEKSAHAVSLGTPDPRLWLHRGVILAASAKDATGIAAAKKIIDDALAKGQRFDPSSVALAKEAEEAR